MDHPSFKGFKGQYRLFLPSLLYPDETKFFERLKRSQFRMFTPPPGQVCPLCLRIPPDSGCTIINVSGLYRRREKQASYAIYFARESEYNFSGFLKGPQERTRQMVELIAGIEGVRAALTNPYLQGPKMGGNITSVIIRTNSEYLVKGATEWIYHWAENGWRTLEAGEVLGMGKKYLFEELIDAVVELENKGVGVFFWPVDNAQNRVASKLSNGILNGVRP